MQLRPKKLSDRQQCIMDFIRSYLREHGYPPAIREIQQACHISSTSVVDYNLHILQREGLLRRSPEVSRGIELLGPDGQRVEPMQPFRMVPLVGAVAAGAPLPVFQDVDPNDVETVEVPPSLLPPTGDVYALRVRGLSMIDALIDDGDIVLMAPGTQVRDGEMAVAWLRDEGEATLKHIFREGRRVRLQPANAQMGPIYAEADNVEVQGRVVGVIRSLR